MEHRAVVIQVSCSREADALMIMSVLVEERMAACVQKQEIHSTYRWQGRVEDQREYLLNIKTVPSKLEEIKSTVRAIHTSEVYELVVLPIVDGNEEYLQWIEQQVS